MPADLHAHTTSSDGALSPEALVALAVERGLSTLAITDHDAVDAVAPARAAAPPGLTILAGAELSCRVGEREAHILAYGMDLDHAGFRAALARYAAAREARAREMVEALGRHGVVLDFEDVRRLSGGTIARPHVARAIVDAGHAATIDEAFARWIGRHAPAFVDKPRVDPREACELVRAAGGVPGLAHPGTFRRDDLIPALVEAGMLALEVRHTEHSAAGARHYEAMAESLGLVPTGGSDFHGTPGHRSRLGTPAVPDAWVAGLVARFGSPS